MTPFQGCGLALLISALALGSASAQPVKLGAAHYFLAPKGSDKAMPAAPLRTEPLLRTAAPTNQWYSSLVFNPKPEVIFAQPLTVRMTALCVFQPIVDGISG